MPNTPPSQLGLEFLWGSPHDPKMVELDYTNWKGERRRRRIIPESIHFGSNEYHPEKQWLIRAWDVDKQATREFALLGFAQ